MRKKSGFKLNWKYALGELVLIFLGISLAITFQNWNEGRKNDIELRSILLNLETELKEDSAAYHLIFERLRYREKNIAQLRAYFENIPQQIDSGRTALSIVTSGYVTTYYPGFAVYTELLGSGKLSLVNSNEIKKGLAQYQSTVAIGQGLDATYHPYSKSLEKKMISFLSETPAVTGYDTIPPPSYKEIKFDLRKMSLDSDVIGGLQFASYYTNVERVYKQDAIMPSLQSLLTLIRAELK